MGDDDQEKAKETARRRRRDPLIGHELAGAYRIDSLIGRGGMGRVYKAEQFSLGRWVALKVVNPDGHGDSDPEFHRRFILEAKLCSRLQHPNTITVFDYGRTHGPGEDELLYIVMELLEGRTLYRALKSNGHLSLRRSLRVARQICGSLAEAHQQGVIHRDIKPANIFLCETKSEAGFIKVLDFGLVKELRESGDDLTKTGLFMGSPKYISPEQIRGEKLDPRADIYALGIVLFEMLTGKAPFENKNPVDILMHHMHTPPPRLCAPRGAPPFGDDLRALIARCLDKDRALRFENMDALALAIDNIAIPDEDPSISASLVSFHDYTPPTVSPRPLSAEEAALSQKAEEYLRHESTPSARIPSASETVDRPEEDSAPVADDDNIPARHPKRVASPRMLRLIALSLGALFVSTWFGWDAWRQSRDAGSENPNATSRSDSRNELAKTIPRHSPTKNGERAGGGETPGTASTAQIRLSSDPPGASVITAEGTLGSTPLSIPILPSSPEIERSFLFRMRGYQDVRATRRVGRSPLHIHVRLRPEHPEGDETLNTAVDQHGEGNQGSSDSPQRPPVKGYKLDPY